MMSFILCPELIMSENPKRSASVTEKFVREENLKRFRRLLAETTDEDRRRVLSSLITSLLEQDERPTALPFSRPA
jgi:hypothetical protein